MIWIAGVDWGVVTRGREIVRISCRGQRIIWIRCWMITRFLLVKCQKSWTSNGAVRVECHTNGSVSSDDERASSTAVLTATIVTVSGAHFNVIAVTANKPVTQQVEMGEIQCYPLPWRHCDVPRTTPVVWIVPREARTVNNASGSWSINRWTTWTNTFILKVYL